MGVTNSTARQKDYVNQVIDDIEKEEKEKNKLSNNQTYNDNTTVYLDDFTELLSLLKNFSELNNYDSKFVLQNKSILKELDENLVNLKNTQTDSENYYTTSSHIYEEKELTNKNYEFLSFVLCYSTIFLVVITFLLLSIRSLNYKL
jgi:hypothetical protein